MRGSQPQNAARAAARQRRLVCRGTRLGIGILCLLVTACASDGTRPAPELPEGWGSAATAKPHPAAQPTAASNSEARHRERAAIALRSGDHLLASGDRTQALREYMTAHRLDPEAPAPRERIAYLHLERNPERAEALFASVLEGNPERLSAQVGLGLARLARNDLPGAVAALEKARTLDPDCGRASAALGLAYDGLHRHADAQTQYRHAATRRPNDVEVWNNLGVSRSMTGDYEDAVSAFQEALRLRPDDPALRNNLGYALGRLGRYSEALDAFRSGGSEAEAHNNLGYVLLQNGEHARARDHFEQALETATEGRPIIARNLRAARAELRSVEDGQ